MTLVQISSSKLSNIWKCWSYSQPEDPSPNQNQGTAEMTTAVEEEETDVADDVESESGHVSVYEGMTREEVFATFPDVGNLQELGFPLRHCVRALVRTNGDIEAAAEYVFTNMGGEEDDFLPPEEENEEQLAEDADHAPTTGEDEEQGGPTAETQTERENEGEKGVDFQDDLLLSAESIEECCRRKPALVRLIMVLLEQSCQHWEHSDDSNGPGTLPTFLKKLDPSGVDIDPSQEGCVCLPTAMDKGSTHAPYCLEPTARSLDVLDRLLLRLLGKEESRKKNADDGPANIVPVVDMFGDEEKKDLTVLTLRIIGKQLRRVIDSTVDPNDLHLGSESTVVASLRSTVAGLLLQDAKVHSFNESQTKDIIRESFLLLQTGFSVLFPLPEDRVNLLSLVLPICTKPSDDSNYIRHRLLRTLLFHASNSLALLDRPRLNSTTKLSGLGSQRMSLVHKPGRKLNDLSFSFVKTYEKFHMELLKALSALDPSELHFELFRNLKVTMLLYFTDLVALAYRGSTASRIIPILSSFCHKLIEAVNSESSSLSTITPDLDLFPFVLETLYVLPNRVLCQISQSILPGLTELSSKCGQNKQIGHEDPVRSIQVTLESTALAKLQTPHCKLSSELQYFGVDRVKTNAFPGVLSGNGGFFIGTLLPSWFCELQSPSNRPENPRTLSSVLQSYTETQRKTEIMKSHHGLKQISEAPSHINVLLLFRPTNKEGRSSRSCGSEKKDECQLYSVTLDVSLNLDTKTRTPSFRLCAESLSVAAGPVHRPDENRLTDSISLSVRTRAFSQSAGCLLDANGINLGHITSNIVSPVLLSGDKWLPVNGTLCFSRMDSSAKDILGVSASFRMAGLVNSEGKLNCFGLSECSELLASFSANVIIGQSISKSLKATLLKRCGIASAGEEQLSVLEKLLGNVSGNFSLVGTVTVSSLRSSKTGTFLFYQRPISSNSQSRFGSVNSSSIIGIAGRAVNAGIKGPPWQPSETELGKFLSKGSLFKGKSLQTILKSYSFNSDDKISHYQLSINAVEREFLSHLRFADKDNQPDDSSFAKILSFDGYKVPSKNVVYNLFCDPFHMGMSHSRRANILKKKCPPAWSILQPFLQSRGPKKGPLIRKREAKASCPWAESLFMATLVHTLGAEAIILEVLAAIFSQQLDAKEILQNDVIEGYLSDILPEEMTWWPALFSKWIGVRSMNDMPKGIRMYMIRKDYSRILETNDDIIVSIAYRANKFRTWLRLQRQNLCLDSEGKDANVSLEQFTRLQAISDVAKKGLHCSSPHESLYSNQLLLEKAEQCSKGNARSRESYESLLLDLTDQCLLLIHSFVGSENVEHSLRSKTDLPLMVESDLAAFSTEDVDWWQSVFAFDDIELLKQGSSAMNVPFSELSDSVGETASMDAYARDENECDDEEDETLVGSPLQLLSQSSVGLPNDNSSGDFCGEGSQARMRDTLTNSVANVLSRQLSLERQPSTASFASNDDCENDEEIAELMAGTIDNDSCEANLLYRKAGFDLYDYLTKTLRFENSGYRTLAAFIFQTSRGLMRSKVLCSALKLVSVLIGTPYESSLFLHILSTSFEGLHRFPAECTVPRPGMYLKGLQDSSNNRNRSMDMMHSMLSAHGKNHYLTGIEAAPGSVNQLVQTTTFSLLLTAIKLAWQAIQDAPAEFSSYLQIFSFSWGREDHEFLLRSGLIALLRRHTGIFWRCSLERKHIARVQQVRCGESISSTASLSHRVTNNCSDYTQFWKSIECHARNNRFIMVAYEPLVLFWRCYFCTPSAPSLDVNWSWRLGQACHHSSSEGTKARTLCEAVDYFVHRFSEKQLLHDFPYEKGKSRVECVRDSLRFHSHWQAQGATGSINQSNFSLDGVLSEHLQYIRDSKSSSDVPLSMKDTVARVISADTFYVSAWDVSGADTSFREIQQAVLDTLFALVAGGLGMEANHLLNICIDFGLFSLSDKGELDLNGSLRVDINEFFQTWLYWWKEVLERISIPNLVSGVSENASDIAVLSCQETPDLPKLEVIDQQVDLSEVSEKALRALALRISSTSVDIRHKVSTKIRQPNTTLILLYASLRFAIKDILVCVGEFQRGAGESGYFCNVPHAHLSPFKSPSYGGQMSQTESRLEGVSEDLTTFQGGIGMDKCLFVFERRMYWLQCVATANYMQAAAVHIVSNTELLRGMLSLLALHRCDSAVHVAILRFLRALAPHLTVGAVKDALPETFVDNINRSTGKYHADEKVLGTNIAGAEQGDMGIPVKTFLLLLVRLGASCVCDIPLEQASDRLKLSICSHTQLASKLAIFLLRRLCRSYRWRRLCRGLFGSILDSCSSMLSSEEVCNDDEEKAYMCMLSASVFAVCGGFRECNSSGSIAKVCPHALSMDVSEISSAYSDVLGLFARIQNPVVLITNGDPASPYCRVRLFLDEAFPRLFQGLFDEKVIEISGSSCFFNGTFTVPTACLRPFETIRAPTFLASNSRMAGTTGQILRLCSEQLNGTSDVSMVNFARLCLTESAIFACKVSIEYNESEPSSCLQLMAGIRNLQGIKSTLLTETERSFSMINEGLCQSSVRSRLSSWINELGLSAVYNGEPAAVSGEHLVTLDSVCSEQMGVIIFDCQLCWLASTLNYCRQKALEWICLLEVIATNLDLNGCKCALGEYSATIDEVSCQLSISIHDENQLGDYMAQCERVLTEDQNGLNQRVNKVVQCAVANLYQCLVVASSIGECFNNLACFNLVNKNGSQLSRSLSPVDSRSFNSDFKSLFALSSSLSISVDKCRFLLSSSNKFVFAAAFWWNKERPPTSVRGQVFEQVSRRNGSSGINQAYSDLLSLSQGYKELRHSRYGKQWRSILSSYAYMSALCNCISCCMHIDELYRYQLDWLVWARKGLSTTILSNFSQERMAMMHEFALFPGSYDLLNQCISGFCDECTRIGRLTFETNQLLHEELLKAHAQAYDSDCDTSVDFRLFLRLQLFCHYSSSGSPGKFSENPHELLLLQKIYEEKLGSASSVKPGRRGTIEFFNTFFRNVESSLAAKGQGTYGKKVLENSMELVSFAPFSRILKSTDRRVHRFIDFLSSFGSGEHISNAAEVVNRYERDHKHVLRHSARGIRKADADARTTMTSFARPCLLSESVQKQGACFDCIGKFGNGPRMFLSKPDRSSDKSSAVIPLQGQEMTLDIHIFTLAPNIEDSDSELALSFGGDDLIRCSNKGVLPGPFSFGIDSLFHNEALDVSISASDASIDNWKSPDESLEESKFVSLRNGTFLSRFLLQIDDRSGVIYASRVGSSPMIPISVIDTPRDDIALHISFTGQNMAAMIAGSMKYPLTSSYVVPLSPIVESAMHKAVSSFLEDHDSTAVQSTANQKCFKLPSKDLTKNCLVNDFQAETAYVMFPHFLKGCSHLKPITEELNVSALAYPRKSTWSCSSSLSYFIKEDVAFERISPFFNPVNLSLFISNRTDKTVNEHDILCPLRLDRKARFDLFKTSIDRGRSGEENYESDVNHFFQDAACMLVMPEAEPVVKIDDVDSYVEVEVYHTTVQQRPNFRIGVVPGTVESTNGNHFGIMPLGCWESTRNGTNPETTLHRICAAIRSIKPSLRTKACESILLPSTCVVSASIFEGVPDKKWESFVSGLPAVNSDEKLRRVGGYSKKTTRIAMDLAAGKMISSPEGGCPLSLDSEYSSSDSLELQVASLDDIRVQSCEAGEQVKGQYRVGCGFRRVTTSDKNEEKCLAFFTLDGKPVGSQILDGKIEDFQIVTEFPAPYHDECQLCANFLHPSFFAADWQLISDYTTNAIADACDDVPKNIEPEVKSAKRERYLGGSVSPALEKNLHDFMRKPADLPSSLRRMATAGIPGKSSLIAHEELQFDVLRTSSVTANEESDVGDQAVPESEVSMILPTTAEIACKNINEADSLVLLQNIVESFNEAWEKWQSIRVSEYSLLPLRSIANEIPKFCGVHSSNLRCEKFQLVNGNRRILTIPSQFHERSRTLSLRVLVGKSGSGTSHGVSKQSTCISDVSSNREDGWAWSSSSLSTLSAVKRRKCLKDCEIFIPGVGSLSDMMAVRASRDKENDSSKTETNNHTGSDSGSSEVGQVERLFGDDSSNSAGTVESSDSDGIGETVSVASPSQTLSQEQHVWRVQPTAGRLFRQTTMFGSHGSSSDDEGDSDEDEDSYETDHESSSLLSEDRDASASIPSTFQLTEISSTGVLGLSPNLFTADIEPDVLFVSLGFPGLKVTSGKWYYECKVISGSAGTVQIGWADAQFTPNASAGEGVGDDSFSWAYDGTRRQLWHDQRQQRWGRLWRNGIVICCALDLDEGKMEFGHDGDYSRPLGTAFTGIDASTLQGMYPAISGHGMSLKFYMGGTHGLAPKYSKEGFTPIGESVGVTEISQPVEEGEYFPELRVGEENEGAIRSLTRMAAMGTTSANDEVSERIPCYSDLGSVALSVSVYGNGCMLSQFSISKEDVQFLTHENSEAVVEFPHVEYNIEGHTDVEIFVESNSSSSDVVSLGLEQIAVSEKKSKSLPKQLYCLDITAHNSMMESLRQRWGYSRDTSSASEFSLLHLRRSLEESRNVCMETANLEGDRRDNDYRWCMHGLFGPYPFMEAGGLAVVQVLGEGEQSNVFSGWVHVRLSMCPLTKAYWIRSLPGVSGGRFSYDLPVIEPLEIGDTANLTGWVRLEHLKSINKVFGNSYSSSSGSTNALGADMLMKKMSLQIVDIEEAAKACLYSFVKSSCLANSLVKSVDGRDLLNIITMLKQLFSAEHTAKMKWSSLKLSLSRLSQGYPAFIGRGRFLPLPFSTTFSSESDHGNWRSTIGDDWQTVSYHGGARRTVNDALSDIRSFFEEYLTVAPNSTKLLEAASAECQYHLNYLGGACKPAVSLIRESNHPYSPGTNGYIPQPIYIENAKALVVQFHERCELAFHSDVLRFSTSQAMDDICFSVSGTREPRTGEVNRQTGVNHKFFTFVVPGNRLWYVFDSKDIGDDGVRQHYGFRFSVYPARETWSWEGSVSYEKNMNWGIYLLDFLLSGPVFKHVRPGTIHTKNMVSFLALNMSTEGLESEAKRRLCEQLTKLLRSPNLFLPSQFPSEKLLYALSSDLMSSCLRAIRPLSKFHDSCTMDGIVELCLACHQSILHCRKLERKSHAKEQKGKDEKVESEREKIARPSLKLPVGIGAVQETLQGTDSLRQKQVEEILNFLTEFNALGDSLIVGSRAPFSFICEAWLAACGNIRVVESSHPISGKKVSEITVRNGSMHGASVSRSTEDCGESKLDGVVFVGVPPNWKCTETEGYYEVVLHDQTELPPGAKLHIGNKTFSAENVNNTVPLKIPVCSTVGSRPCGVRWDYEQPGCDVDDDKSKDYWGFAFQVRYVDRSFNRNKKRSKDSKYLFPHESSMLRYFGSYLLDAAQDLHSWTSTEDEELAQFIGQLQDRSLTTIASKSPRQPRREPFGASEDGNLLAGTFVSSDLAMLVSSDGVGSSDHSKDKFATTRDVFSSAIIWNIAEQDKVRYSSLLSRPIQSIMLRQALLMSFNQRTYWALPLLNLTPKQLQVSQCSGTTRTSFRGLHDIHQTSVTTAGRQRKWKEMLEGKSSYMAHTTRSSYHWSIDRKVKDLRHVLLKVLKVFHLSRMVSDDSPGSDDDSDEEPVTDIPPLTLDNYAASASAQKGYVSPWDSNSCFVQAFEKHNKLNPSKFRGKKIEYDRVFEISFRHESGIDQGGVYREGMQRIVEDVMSKNMDLFIPVGQSQTSASDTEAGSYAHTFIPNPIYSSPVVPGIIFSDSPKVSKDPYRPIAMYEYVGKLLGISLRHNELLPFNFPTFVWKCIQDSEVNIDDLSVIDDQDFERLKRISLALKNCEEDADVWTEVTDYKFVIRSSCGNADVELCPGGASRFLTYENGSEYISKYLDFRKREFSLAVEAIRRGLMCIVPRGVLPLLTPKELEIMIAGEDDIDIEYLKQHTVSQHDPTIVAWFWRVLSSLTPEERCAYIRFVWGRSRLPPPGQPWEHQHYIGVLEDGGDNALPEGHTCFFHIDLPRYSSEERLRWGLQTAIHYGSAGILNA